ncbi:MAG TPA: choice-of-anchor R domain-containing protein [Bryobacteraceae bacterium]|nr:choice-of-anchor R domain-containing protein [Bryobacteraceae bacterium]
MRIAFAALGLFLVSLQAGASTIYTDFGSGHSFNGSSGSGITSSVGAAAEFTALLTASLTSIDIAAKVILGTPTFTVKIAHDNSNSPGAVIESMTINSIPSSASVVTATSSLDPILTSGTKYWIEVVAGGSTEGTWYVNNQSVLGNRSTSSNGGSTWGGASLSVQQAFDVNGTLTAPEPSSAVLMLLPLGILMAYQGRKAAKSGRVHRAE